MGGGVGFRVIGVIGYSLGFRVIGVIGVVGVIGVIGVSGSGRFRALMGV